MTIYSLDSFFYLEPVCCSMSSSNCCFLIFIQISQEAGQVVLYLFQNIPQFIVIHTVKGFGIVNKAETDAFLELSCFFDDPADVCNLIPGSSAFSQTSLNIRKFFSILFLYFFALITEEAFLISSCYFYDPADVGNLISGSSAFSKTSLTIWNHGSCIAEAWLGEFWTLLY